MNNPNTYLALILITAIMPALCCCHDDDNPGDKPSPDRELAFVPSRAEDLSGKIDPLADYYDSFGVWASYCTPSSQDRAMVFGGGALATYQVNYNTFWYYNAIGDQTFEYWVASAKDYRFDAVAPVPERKDLVLSFSKDGGYSVRLNNITANTTSVTDHERLAASNVRHVNDNVSAAEGCCDEDLYKAGTYTQLTTLYSPVNMIFHHILSIIEFRIDPASSVHTEFTSINAAFADGQIYSSACYNVTDMGWTDYGDAANAMPPMSLSGAKVAQVLEIPQDVTGKVLSLAVTTAEGAVYRGQISFTKPWIGGKRYIYTLTINAEDVDERILVSVSVEDYKAYQAIDVDDELVNW